MREMVNFLLFLSFLYLQSKYYLEKRDIIFIFTNNNDKGDIVHMDSIFLRHQALHVNPRCRSEVKVYPDLLSTGCSGITY